jgi:hypothetical protein
MRDAINNNPVAQIAVVAVLLVAVGFFVLSSTGGGGKEKAATETAVDLAPAEGGAGAAGPASLEAVLSGLDPAQTEVPPLPRRVTAAWEANRTLVLLFVHNGGIDDRKVENATRGLRGFRDVALFVVPAAKISRYAAIAEGVGVDRVPALVVVTPKHLEKSAPVASVRYGFQSPESVSQAVIDAGYEGPTFDYHP